MGFRSFQVTGNILKSIKPNNIINNKNLIKNWKKRENPVVSAGVIQSLKHQKRCRRMHRRVESHLTSTHYNTQHS